MKQPAKPPRHPVTVIPLGHQPRLWQTLALSQQRQLAQCLATLLQRLAQDETTVQEVIDESVG